MQAERIEGGTGRTTDGQPGARRARRPRPPRRHRRGETWQDARYGLRWLSRHPGFTAAALLTLALTIGASSAIFSLVNAVLLAPLPFPDDDRLMVVTEAAPAVGFPQMPFSPLDFLDFVGAQRSFSALAAYRNGSVELAGEGESERIDIAKVSPSLFDVLGVQPSLGRAFRPRTPDPAPMRPSSATRCGRAASIATRRWSDARSCSIASRSSSSA